MASCIVDATVYEQEKESRLSARRFNKHVAERKRRARINTALDELKSMILDNMNKDPEEFEKMEKADILDLTVKFLRAAQQQKKMAASHPAAPTAPVMPQQRVPEPHPVASAAAYAAGYNQSLNQVQRFVGASDLDHATAARLAAHLKSRSMMAPSQQRLLLPKPTVRRCDPSPRLCRDLNKEISYCSPKMSDFTSLAGDFQSLQTTSRKTHPAVNSRVVSAHHTTGVWRPWQVSA